MPAYRSGDRAATNAFSRWLAPPARHLRLWHREKKAKKDNEIRVYGGESGIRTRVTVSRKHTFQACAFNHSATSPHRSLYAGRFRRAGWECVHLLGRGLRPLGRQSGCSQPACTLRLRPNTIACIPPRGSSSRSSDACQAVASQNLPPNWPCRQNRPG